MDRSEAVKQSVRPSSESGESGDRVYGRKSWRLRGGPRTGALPSTRLWTTRGIGGVQEWATPGGEERMQISNAAAKTDGTKSAVCRDYNVCRVEERWGGGDCSPLG